MKTGILAFFLLLLFPCLSFAHGSHGSGFMAGFTHPIFGLDHNFAILGIGILGSLMDKKRWYLYPFIFWIPMAVGGFLGVGQEGTVIVEKIIAASVLIIGIIIGFQLTKFKFLVFFLLAFFGFFHGFAHGTEMPETTTVLKYISGYSLGAILLFGLGYLIYLYISRNRVSDFILKMIGGLLVGAGTFFLLG